MKFGRLNRALLQARPYEHNPLNRADPANIGKRFRVIRHDRQPELVGLVGECEFPLPDQFLQLKFRDEAGKSFSGSAALADLVEV